MRDGMHLPETGVIIVGLLYLATSIVFGLIAAHNLIAGDGKTDADLGLVLLTSASTAISVASLFYLRKLYKDTFAGLSVKNADVAVSIPATLIYYVSRPLFAAAISVLFSVLMFSAVKEFSQDHGGVNSSFVFFSAVSSFVISVATGAGVSRLEELATSGHTFFRPPM